MSVPPWTAEQRQKGWIVLSFIRTKLQLTLSPCIADAYVILHHYFRTDRDRQYNFSILLTAALFLSCKIENLYRSMTLVFKELCSCLQITSSKIGDAKNREIFGDRDYSKHELTESEIDNICMLEVDFLNALDWNSQIELPFEHVNRFRTELASTFSDQSELADVLESIVRDICFFIPSEHYLDIPPGCLAAAVSSLHVDGLPIPANMRLWIQTQHDEHREMFEYAIALIDAINETL